MTLSKLAPIVLFTYNRPNHLSQTINSLKKNLLANESNLYIYSDGPKNNQDANLVSLVREYIKSIDGFKSINIIERDKNWGLANNIINGVTSVVNEYGKIINETDTKLYLCDLFWNHHHTNSYYPVRLYSFNGSGRQSYRGTR